MKFIIFIGAFITAFLFFSCHSALAGTDYYRWQDTLGHWHFSDQPPALPSPEADVSKVVGQAVNLSAPPSKSINHQPIKRKSPRKNKHQVSKRIAHQRKQKAKQEQACQILKLRLASIKTKLRAGYKEPSGNKLRAQRRTINTKIYRQC